MKSKSGYGIKKKGSIKVAGGPSFELVRPADDDPGWNAADNTKAKRLMIEYYKTPQGQQVRQKQQRLKQLLQGA